MIVAGHREQRPQQAQVPQRTGPEARPSRSALKQVGFAEGSALLAPPVQSKDGAGPQMPKRPTSPGEMPKLPPTPGQMPQLPQLPQTPVQQGPQMPQLPQTPGQQGPQMPAPKLPKLPQTPPEKAQAEAAEAAEQQKQAKVAAQEQQKRVNKWCVYGLDDPSAVSYCITKESTPDDAANWLQQSTQWLNVVKNKPEVYARYSKVMTDDEIILVVLYTTQASYAMNAVLRGQLKSKPWVDAYGKLAADSAKALKKAPKGATNAQGSGADRALIDPSRAEDKIVPIGTVYRCDNWSGFFDPVFASEYQTGRALEEPGFLSTTLVQGSYGSTMPVRKTIEDAKVSRSVADVSAVKTENEALFPPGQRFQIVSIELEDTTRGTRFGVGSPQTVFPMMDGGPQAFNRPGRIWHVRMKHTGVAKGKKNTRPAAGKDDKQKKGGAEKGPGPLEKLLGLG